jgi:intracellular sulfur oxidation DsrE/DsrF family protein
MKKVLTIGVLLVSLSLSAQTRVFPVIKNYGGVFEVPDAEQEPNPELDYKIVIELATGSEKPGVFNASLNNIARLINLHVMGGVPKEKLQIVVAIHGEAAYSIMNNEAYRDKYKTGNPNLDLYRELAEAGVTFFICGQSLISRDIDRTKMVPQVKIATSMLTTITTHQLRGYAVLKF